MNPQIFFDIFCKKFSYLIYMGKISLLLSFVFHIMILLKNFICKRFLSCLCPLFCFTLQAVSRWTTTEHDHGTQHDHGKNRPTKQAHKTGPHRPTHIGPCEFLDHEFLDVNF